MSAKAKKAAPAKAEKSSKKAAAPAASEMTEAQLAAMASEAGDEEAEEEEMSSSSGGGAGGNAAALAAATSSGESASFKNFRHHPDMENFYRFIYENDLRLEALAIIDEMMIQKQNRKMTKQAKTQSH